MSQEASASLRLANSVDLAILQRLQDGFAAMGQVSMSICDADGVLITQPSCTSPLCRLLSQTTTGSRDCIHSIELQAAAATKQPKGVAATSATCHAGVDLITVPIEIDDRQIGSIVVGDRPTRTLTNKQARGLVDQHGLDEKELKSLIDDLPPWTVEQRETTIRCAAMLAETIALLCRQDLAQRERIGELTAVYDIAGILAGSDDLTEILETTARIVAEVMRVKACAIRLLNNETGELIMLAGHNLSKAYINKGIVLRGQNPIDDAALDGQIVYIADARTDPRIRYPEESKCEGIVSGLCVAMTFRGERVGVIRVYTGEPHRFSLFEESLLQAIGSQAGAAVVTARLNSQRSESRKHRRQLQYAGEIQRRMIPEKAPVHKNIELAGVYAPMLEVGGDFYDYLPLPWGNLGLCVADVVGKGVPAALMMASVRSALRGHARSILEINEVMAHVNHHLCRDTLIHEFATLFYGIFSPDGGQFTYCNAGHEPPLLLRRDEFTRLETGGLIIGVSPNETYEREVIDLEPGDVLVFVTDGVTEATNFQGEQFGRKRLRQALAKYKGEKVDTLANQILWDVRRFAGLSPQADDLTIVAARVGG